MTHKFITKISQAQLRGQYNNYYITHVKSCFQIWLMHFPKGRSCLGKLFGMLSVEHQKPIDPHGIFLRSNRRQIIVVGPTFFLGSDSRRDFDHDGIGSICARRFHEPHMEVDQGKVLLDSLEMYLPTPTGEFDPLSVPSRKRAGNGYFTDYHAPLFVW